MKDRSLRGAVSLVALLNLAYFGIEFGMALRIGSVSLIADSIDFLEDTSLNLLILIGLGWNARWRARLGIVLSGILLIPSLATLWMAWNKFLLPIPPSAVPLSITGFGALAVNLSCAFILAAYRHHRGSLTRAAFLSARNDAYANVAIILSGAVTSYTLSVWPDLLVGVGIGVLNAGAAWEVYEAGRQERQLADGESMKRTSEG